MEELLGKMQELLADPESMQQLGELAQMLRTEQAEEAQSGAVPDAGELQAILPALMQLGQDRTPDKNAALLLALRPHLGTRRQERVDKAVRLLRVWKIVEQLQASGMLQKLL